MNGGERIARALQAQETRFLFTLCGGHISPILVGAKRYGIRVIDVRHEASAVFAADAVARLSGVPGVAAVTAGPGCTNTITAIKNAQLAGSPIVLLGGATGTILKGRGALQDIDQVALFAPHVKWVRTVTRLRDLEPSIHEAFYRAMEGIPGPVFVECPIDLLYDETVVRSMYGAKSAGSGTRGLGERVLQAYLHRHVNRLFARADPWSAPSVVRPAPMEPRPRAIARLRRALLESSRPVLLIGSQATLDVSRIEALAASIERLGVPVYLSGMARGLLGRGHHLQLRHQRRKALREADLVILAGVPCDFRLDYGRQIGRQARLVAIHRSPEDATRNRRPDQAIIADPAATLIDLAENHPDAPDWSEWLGVLRGRDDKRQQEIVELSGQIGEFLNPLALCRKIEEIVPRDSVLVADGGDFVATASYILSPRRPLSWLDPGPFGTLGVGGGFALGAKLCRPEAEVWLLYGDGSAAFSLAEFDTFVRHDVPIVGIVGNDASWSQIARDQVEILHDDVGTELRRSDYDLVAEGFGGKGLRLHRSEDIEDVLRSARSEVASGRPVLVNALLGKSDFRKGSISV